MSRIASISNSSINTPFAVIKRQKPNALGAWEAQVNINSTLLLSIIPNDIQVITGLNSWFDLDGEDFIWLDISIGDTFITSATIASWGIGSNPTFTPNASPGASDGPFNYTTTTDVSGNLTFIQTRARIPIALSHDDDQGNPVLTQLLFSNLIMETSAYNGLTDDGNAVVSILYPRNFTGAYV